MKRLLFLFYILSFIDGFGQSINCSLNYYVSSSSNQIRSYDPATNTHTNVGITLPAGANGLAISNNLNGGSPSPTFYTCVNGVYWYWNGTGWTNTGHSTGNASAVNPGGSGPYIYNLNGLGQTVYRYNGTGNSVLVTTLPGFGGPFDLIGDSQGNFYVLNGVSGNQRLTVYNPQGQVICTYTISGLPAATAGGGYSVINGVIYANINTGTYRGVFNGNHITFVATNHYDASDYGSCAFPPFNTTITATLNNINACSNETSTLTASTNITGPTYTWSGPGIVSGQGTNSIVVNQAGTYSLVVNSTSGNCASTTTTTYVITSSSVSPTIVAQPPVCVNAASVQFSSTPSSGTWTASCGACISSSGSFNPAVAGPGTHTVSFTATGCSTAATSTIVVNALPSVDAGPDQTICTGQSTILSGAGATTYTWDNGVSNGVAFTPSATNTYTVTGTANGCSSTDQVVVAIGSQVAPTFTQVGPICTGQAIGPLPTTSDNSITGTWSPALNNTATTTYTFTPNSGQCASTATMTITVDAQPAPIFTQVAPICSGDALSALPTTSDNGVSGTWSPAVNNTTTTTYTFTPGSAQCASNTTMTITVNPNVTPQFTQVAAICPGGTLSPLPTTSDNGVTGTWSPALNNMVTTTYTFTPNSGQCASTATMTIVVNQGTTPQFTLVAAICPGGTLSPLPTTSNNGVVGTWSPALNNMATTTYTFTPNAGQCASSVTMIITVNNLPIIYAGPDVSVCENDTIVLSGQGGTSYFWNNGVNNGGAFVPPTGTTTYVVTGTDANGCSNTDQVIVTTQAPPSLSVYWQQDALCAPSTVTFFNNSQGNLVNCLWQFSDGSNIQNCASSVTHVFTQAGLFDVTFFAETTLGCSNTISFNDTIEVENIPIANFNIANTMGSVITFNNLSQGADTYQWTFAPGATSTETHPTYNYGDNQGVYSVELIAINNAGCRDTTYRSVTIVEDLIFYVPNSFTPDGDQNNNEFLPIFTAGFDPYDYTLMIYNRWGEPVFESHDATVGWDGTYGGKNCQDGAYTWIIEFKTLSSDKRIHKVGHLTMIR